MRELDYNNSIAITREIYWVGFYDETSKLHCNPYLLIDEDDVLFFDPGSIPHFPVIMRKVIDMVNPSELSLIIASHQDPDICGNLAVLEDVISRSDLKIVAHTNSIRFIRHYGVQSGFYHVNDNDFKIELKSGRKLEFFFTPYLHSPGAIATYDHQSKTLFSSDIFGALDDNWSLFAGSNFPKAMDSFHQQYMPNNAVLRKFMERLENVDIERILPQHGSVIEGPKVQLAINHLKNLSCGIDLM